MRGNRILESYVSLHRPNYILPNHLIIARTTHQLPIFTMFFANEGLTIGLYLLSTLFSFSFRQDKVVSSKILGISWVTLRYYM